jgi:hypothetical protein
MPAFAETTIAASYDYIEDNSFLILPLLRPLSDDGSNPSFFRFSGYNRAD